MVRNGVITSLVCVRIHSDSQFANYETRSSMPRITSITVSGGIILSIRTRIPSKSRMFPNAGHLPSRVVA